MLRREFIAGLGSAAAWSVVARAQQGDRVRRIGVLMGPNENDPEQRARLSAFTQALADLGWADGRNVRIDLRWFGADTNRIRALAHELVGLQPDIIVTSGTSPTAAVQRETQTIPIVFANVADPVASGIVPRLDRPTGNITGFALFEPSLGGKFNHLIRGGQQGFRDGEAERLGGFEIDGARFLWPARPEDQPVSRFENAPGMDASSAVRIAEAAAIANQAASQDELTV
jgi:putative ABC transport system substrate-binding protein